MMLFFTIILGVMVVILGYTTFNLTKNERADDIIISQQKFINKVDEQVTFSEKD